MRRAGKRLNRYRTVVFNPVQQISARFTHLVDHDRTVNMQCCWANAYAYANMLMGVASVNDGQF